MHAQREGSRERQREREQERERKKENKKRKRETKTDRECVCVRQTTKQEARVTGSGRKKDAERVYAEKR